MLPTRVCRILTVAWYHPSVRVSLDLRTRRVWLELSEDMVLARGKEDHAEVIQVELRHGPTRGYGEAAPVGYFGETSDRTLAFLRDPSTQLLLGDDPFAMETIRRRLAEFPHQRAAQAAIDSALHDLVGQRHGVPTWRLLGLRRRSVATSYTISLGDPDEMARAAGTAAVRYGCLKLKLGGRDGLDVERVRAVRGVTNALLRVDANEAWAYEEALSMVEALAALGVTLCEQPLRAGDPSGPKLKQRSPIPIFVDEDCLVAADIPACAERADGVNVKLTKCGGISEALRIVAAARASGLGLMIGCVTESTLGIAAACQIASLFDHVDLDGNAKLRRDPWGGLELLDGVVLASELPGLGVWPTSRTRADRVRGAPMQAYRTIVRPRLRIAYHRTRRGR